MRDAINKEAEYTPAIRVPLVADTVRLMVKNGIEIEKISRMLELSVEEITVLVSSSQEVLETHDDRIRVSILPAANNDIDFKCGMRSKWFPDGKYNVRNLPDNMQKYWTASQKNVFESGEFLGVSMDGLALFKQLIDQGANYKEIGETFNITEDEVAAICVDWGIISDEGFVKSN